MLAKDIMKTPVITVSADMTIEEVAKLLRQNRISGVPVVDGDGNVLGVVSEMDVMRKTVRPDTPSIWQLFLWEFTDIKKHYEYDDIQRRCLAQTAGEIMTAPAICADENDDLKKIGETIFDHRIKRVFITRQGKLVGVVSRSSFMKLLLRDKTT